MNKQQMLSLYLIFDDEKASVYVFSHHDVHVVDESSTMHEVLKSSG